MFFYFFFRLITTFLVFVWLVLCFLWLRLASVFSASSRKRRERRMAVRLRKSFEFLGATYIKLGQIMAMRPDYFSQEICTELYFMFDRVKPSPYPVIKRIIRKRLGEHFSLIQSIEETPIGSASFAQVHEATLTSGETVAIKIQRPATPMKVRADLYYLKLLIALIDISTIFPYIKLKLFYNDFAAWTRSELDLTIEALNATRLGRSSETDSLIRIPRIYWTLSNKKILTMQVFHGTWASDIVAGRADLPPVFEAPETASAIIQFFLHQIFNDGFFHADPHPGNIVFLEDGTVGLIDFGIVGFMSSDFKRNMLGLLESVSHRDAEAAFSWAVKIVKPSKNADIMALQREYEENINAWFYQQESGVEGFGQKTAASLLISNISSFQKHRVVISNIVVQFYRCIILLESVALSISPATSLIAEMDVFFKKFEADKLREQCQPDAIRRKLISNINFFWTLPGRLNTALNQLTDPDNSFQSNVGTFIRFSLMLLNVLSFALLVLFFVLVIRKIFQPLEQQLFGLDIMWVIFFSLSGALILRFCRRYISIEFR